jgi:hypothetical protein
MIMVVSIGALPFDHHRRPYRLASKETDGRAPRRRFHFRGSSQRHDCWPRSVAAERQRYRHWRR